MLIETFLSAPCYFYNLLIILRENSIFSLQCVITLYAPRKLDPSLKFPSVTFPHQSVAVEEIVMIERSFNGKYDVLLNYVG